jgi:hypothetical protein
MCMYTQMLTADVMNLDDTFLCWLPNLIIASVACLFIMDV